MKEFKSLHIRPYQLMCLVCRKGRPEGGEAYYHESRLDEIQGVIAQSPIALLTMRCNTDSVYRFQNPGRECDTPEGEAYNDLRDLAVLQRLGLVPGDTRPAVDLFECLFQNIKVCEGVCAYPEKDAPGWPRCRFAASGNYERGIAKGIGALVSRRLAAEKKAVKKTSSETCYKAERLRIRPHHLLCMTCFHQSRAAEKLAPIEEDNLYECIDVIQRRPNIPVELVSGPCMICPPCSCYNRDTNLCIGGQSMGLRDHKKDLDTLRRLGLRFGDVLPARELFQRLYACIHTTTQICGNEDGVERSKEWRVCSGPKGSERFVLGRKAALGVKGVKVE